MESSICTTCGDSSFFERERMTDTQPSVPVVLRFRGGQTRTCRSAPQIETERETLTVTLENTSVEDVPFAELKAIFFLRDPNREEGQDAPKLATGSTLSVEFSDGEVMRGMASEYNPERRGFYLYPLDSGRNERVFVVNSAVVSIEVEKF